MQVASGLFCPWLEVLKFLNLVPIVRTSYPLQVLSTCQRILHFLPLHAILSNLLKKFFQLPDFFFLNFAPSRISIHLFLEYFSDVHAIPTHFQTPEKIRFQPSWVLSSRLLLFFFFFLFLFLGYICHSKQVQMLAKIVPSYLSHGCTKAHEHNANHKTRNTTKCSCF